MRLEKVKPHAADPEVFKGGSVEIWIDSCQAEEVEASDRYHGHQRGTVY